MLCISGPKVVDYSICLSFFSRKRREVNTAGLGRNILPASRLCPCHPLCFLPALLAVRGRVRARVGTSYHVHRPCTSCPRVLRPAGNSCGHLSRVNFRPSGLIRTARKPEVKYPYIWLLFWARGRDGMARGPLN